MEQSLGLLHVLRVKACSEPVVHICQHLVSFMLLALLLPSTLKLVPATPLDWVPYLSGVLGVLLMILDLVVATPLVTRRVWVALLLVVPGMFVRKWRTEQTRAHAVGNHWSARAQTQLLIAVEAAGTYE